MPQENLKDKIVLDLSPSERDHYLHNLARAGFLLHHLPAEFKDEVFHASDCIMSIYEALFKMPPQKE